VFFYVAKIAWFALQPSSLMLVLLFLGLVMLWSRYARAGRRVVLLAGLLLLVTGLSPLGHAVMLPLEDRFPPANLDAGPPPTGIIVLGGAQDMLISGARNVSALTEAGERIVETAVLAHRFPGAQVVVSSGAVKLVYERKSEAQGTYDILTGLGIDSSRIRLDERSRDTYENARYTKELVKPRPGERWILVTSANHMPRAMGCFRRAGFDVEPWPVDYRTRGPADLTRFFSSPSSGWWRLDIAVRQWAGLIAYRLAGRTDSFFPAP